MDIQHLHLLKAIIYTVLEVAAIVFIPYIVGRLCMGDKDDWFDTWGFGFVVSVLGFGLLIMVLALFRYHYTH